MTVNHSGLANVEIDGIFLFLFGVRASKIQVTPSHQLRIWLKHIEGKLARERARGRFNHPRYCLSRHVSLAAAKKEITRHLKGTELQK